MTHSSLKGKVVLITGASSGIGQATALHFAALEAKLSITGRNASALEETVAMCKAAGSPDVLAVIGDVTVEEDCESIVRRTIEHFQELHVLINNAGGCAMGGILNSSMKQFDEMMNLNLRSVVHMTMLAVPHLVKTKGAIVNVSSVTSVRGSPTILFYSVAKAAIDHFTRCAAAELAPMQVRVNSVNPGSIPSNAWIRSGLIEEQVEEYYEIAKSWHAMGRMGTQQEVAQAIAFLAGDESAFVTGTSLLVDGGWAVKPVM